MRAVFGNSLLITAAVGASPNLITSSYYVVMMNEYLDFINLMTYDYNSAIDGRVGFNAPLSSIKSSVDAWLNGGASTDKLLLGLPFFGHTFTLSDPNANGTGAPAIGPGQTFGSSQDPGSIMYRDLCAEQMNPGWEWNYDPLEMSGYAVRGNQWFGADDNQCIDAKTRWAMEKSLRGVMVWTVDSDDHQNKCQMGRNPLLQAVGNLIRNKI